MGTIFLEKIKDGYLLHSVNDMDGKFVPLTEKQLFNICDNAIDNLNCNQLQELFEKMTQRLVDMKAEDLSEKKDL